MYNFKKKSYQRWDYLHPLGANLHSTGRGGCPSSCILALSIITFCHCTCPHLPIHLQCFCHNCTNLFYLAALGLPIIIAITVTLAPTTATASSKRQIASSAPKKRLAPGLFSPKGEISGFSLAHCPLEAPLTQESWIMRIASRLHSHRILPFKIAVSPIL